jgi:hypothetical protein
MYLWCCNDLDLFINTLGEINLFEKEPAETMYWLLKGHKVNDESEVDFRRLNENGQTWCSEFVEICGRILLN